jgi:hypothetical protein
LRTWSIGIVKFLLNGIDFSHSETSWKQNTKSGHKEQKGEEEQEEEFGTYTTEEHLTEVARGRNLTFWSHRLYDA